MTNDVTTERRASAWGFGIVRASEWLDVGKSQIDELCALASSAAGVRFEPFVATSYRELVGALENGELGMAWLPPLATIDVDERRLGSPLAIPSRRGSSSYHAALVVRRGGPKSLAELEGRRVAWVQRDSAAGYLVPRVNLAGQGFDVLRFFSREIFVHEHNRVIDAVAGGDADVGATYCHLGEGGRVVSGSWLDADGRALRPLEALATFGPIPNDALVGSNALPAAARSALARWLLALDPRARDLFARLLGTADFRVPSPDHFDALKHSLRVARARGHDALPRDSRSGLRVAKRSS